MNITDRKLVQLLAYLAHQNKNHSINKLKAIKLVWAADRYHVRKYGRLVSGDEYFALKYGPVGSQLKNIAEESDYLPESYIQYAKNYIKSSKDVKTVTSQAEPDMNLLSPTDIEALSFAIDNFGSDSGFDIADFSHKFPEWSKFEELFDSGEVARAKIDIMDFFENPTDVNPDPFSVDTDILDTAKQIFKENREVEKAFTI